MTDHNICTVVTAFYPIPSKISKNIDVSQRQYFAWTTNLFKIKAPIILFTEHHLNDKFINIRQGRPMYIVNYKFEDLISWSKYKSVWIENHKIDHEHDIHSPELYAIWAQKSVFVRDAINLNYFNTKYFMWTDIGCFRNTDHMGKLLNFPIVDHFTPNKILFSSINELPSTCDAPNGIRYVESKNITLVGTLWGGDKQACLNWHGAYFAMLDKFIEHNLFVGKDQVIMLSTLLNNKDLGVVVRKTYDACDPWFFLQYLLSGHGKYSIDVSY